MGEEEEERREGRKCSSALNITVIFTAV